MKNSSHQYDFLKKFLIVIFLLTSKLIYSQHQVFIDENNNTISHDQFLLKFEIPDSTINLRKITSCFIFDSSQVITLFHPDYEEVEMTFKEFILTDTIFLQHRSKSLKEYIVSSKAITRESHDSLHIIDFHFVKGQLFTIQNSISNIKQKYLCKNDSCILVDNRLTLIYNSLNDEQIVYLRDSMYLFNGKYLSNLMPFKTYQQKFSNFLGNFDSKFYFYERYFHSLIKEYLCYNLQSNGRSTLHVTYDQNSFNFISQQYRRVPIAKSDPYFIYTSGQKEGEIFRNTEQIDLSKPDKKNSTILKNLVGSPGFIQMLPILEKSRSEAFLIDSMLYIIDFNESCLLTFVSDTNHSLLHLPMLQEVWYKNQFQIDEKTKKCYFYVRENNRRLFIELDLINAIVKKVKLPDFYNSIFHWEVWDGRFYFLLSDDNKVDWQRIFYSYSIDDPRMK